MTICLIFEIGCKCALLASLSVLVEKVLGSLSRAWQLFMRSTPPVLLAQSSQILGLSNEVKHISELQVVFEKTAKNLTKFASKNLGVRKLNFPSVGAIEPN